VIKSLAKLKNQESKKILINKLKNYLKEFKKLEYEEKNTIKKYFKTIKNLTHRKIKLTHQQIANIIINYITILNISKQYINIGYDIDEKFGVISKLDLSDIGLETKGLPFGWKNNIQKITDIDGIENLGSLRSLDLSYNRIKYISGLESLKKLEELYISNNQIEDLANLENLNRLQNLILLDLHGNKIVAGLTKDHFNPSIKVILKSYLEELEERFDERISI
jgi:Leucine-rich repeat (LRR) protein